MIRTVLRALACLLLATLSLPARAGPSPCANRPVSLGLYDYGLFYYMKTPREGEGIDKDIVDELARRSGCRIETRVMTRARIWIEMEAGRLDMTVSAIPTPERQKFAWFANYITAKNFVVLRRELTGVRGPDEFLARKELRFGVVRSFRHGTEQDRLLDTLRSQQRVDEFVDVEALFWALKQHQINAVFAQPFVYGKLIRDDQLQNEVTVTDWFVQDRGVIGGLVMSRARFGKAEAEAWQALMADMRTDGTLLRIVSRYMPAEDARKMLDF